MGQQDAGFCKRHWKGSKFGGRKFIAFYGISVGLHFVAVVVNIWIP